MRTETRKLLEDYRSQTLYTIDRVEGMEVVMPGRLEELRHRVARVDAALSESSVPEQETEISSTGGEDTPTEKGPDLTSTAEASVRSPPPVHLAPTQAPALKEGDRIKQLKGWKTDAEILIGLMPPVAIGTSAGAHLLKGLHDAISGAALLNPSPTPIAWKAERPSIVGWYFLRGVDWEKHEAHTGRWYAPIPANEALCVMRVEGRWHLRGRGWLDDEALFGESEWLGPLTPDSFIPREEDGPGDWALAFADALGMDSGYKVPIAPAGVADFIVEIKGRIRAATWEDATKLVLGLLPEDSAPHPEDIADMLKAKAAEARD